MFIRSFLVGTAAATALMVSASANAAPIVATAAVAIIGVNASTPSIGLGTVFTNTVVSLVSSATGTLSPFTGSVVTTNPISASLASAVSFSASWGSFSGVVTSVAATGPITNRVVSLDALGVFTPAGPLSPTFTAGPMSLTFSATQTGGIGAAVSASYTIASPPNNRVPEPATLALIGAGMLGFGLVRRRRSA
jgi:hypothetical protein